MGGLALKNTFTRRYSKQEFEQIIPDILNKAKLLFTHAVVTKSYRSKDSFGDADILCLVDQPINIDIKQWILDTFQSKEIVQNSSVFSFEYQELQVDFILIPIRHWESSQTYFSYNDIHNLIGKLYHSIGLKWGFNGLSYVYRIDGKILGEIILTTYYWDAFPLVGLNPQTYKDGFDTLIEMFEYVITSPFFNPIKFDLENLNRINRERDKKRKTYVAFIEYIKPLRNKEYKYLYPDKKVYLGLIDHYFPGFLQKYRNLEIIENTKRKVHSLYNGNLIMQKFNLHGKELGSHMKNFSIYINQTYNIFLQDYVLNINNTEHILEEFKKINNLEYK